MTKYIIISFVVIGLTVGIIIYRNKTQDDLGRLQKIAKPPKLRIVYSRKLKPEEMKQITSSQGAYEILMRVWSSQIETREEMYVLFLDRSNKVFGYHVLSIGGITGTVTDIRLIFSLALTSLATAVLIGHNHPSGNLNPSKSDLDITQKIKNAGDVMDIKLLDHLIVTKHGYYSFIDEGLI